MIKINFRKIVTKYDLKSCKDFIQHIADDTNMRNTKNMSKKIKSS